MERNKTWQKKVSFSLKITFIAEIGGLRAVAAAKFRIAGNGEMGRVKSAATEKLTE